MPRPSRPRGPGATAEGGERRSPSPFEALAALRGKTAHSGRTGNAAPSRKAAKADANAKAAQTPYDEDLALFRAAVNDAVPLPPNGRVEISAPKPAPVPRPRVTEADDAAEYPSRGRATPQPSDDEALLRAELQDVVPLKDTGRLDLGPAPRRGRPLSPHQPPAAEIDPMLLLSPAEDITDPAELFRHMVRDAQPLDTRNRVELEKALPPPEPLKRAADEDAALRESLETPLTFEDRLDIGDEAAFLRPGLPRRVLTDLRRGRWVLQGEIDLHGLNREEARDALARFLAASLQQGRRCVRVIHGKGLRSPGRVGILKHLSRGWLAQREEILAFCQAGPHAGGSGALLVLLRAGSAAPQAAA